MSETPTAENFNDSKTKAAQTLETLLSGQLLDHGQLGQSNFLTPSVTVDTGLASEFGEEKNHNETIHLTIDAPELQQSPSHARQAVEQVLQKIEPIDAWVRARNAEEEVTYVKSKVEELMAAGADIPANTLKWAGFDKKNEEQSEIKEHLVSFDAFDKFSSIDLSLPRNLPENITGEAIAENLENRLDAIKETLAERLIKSEKITDKDKQQALRDKISELNFNVEHNEYSDLNDTTNISISIEATSPEQKAAHEDAKEKGTNGNYDDLKETNVLATLDPQHVTKALSKALQTAGDKADEIMPVIVGAADMRHMLTKKLHAFEKEHPEYAHQIADVLNSNVLVRGYHDPEKTSGHFVKKPVTYKMNDETDGKLIVEMTVPEGEAGKIIHEVAAMAPSAAKSSQKFASIDSMEVVGASTHPDVSAQIKQAVHDAIAPLVGKEMPPEAFADNIKPFAETVVELGTEIKQIKDQAEQNGKTPEQVNSLMNKMLGKIDDLGQAVTNGIKQGAANAQAAEHVSDQEHSFSFTHGKQETPTTTMMPESIKRLVSRAQGSSLAV